MRESVVFYRGFYEGLETLDDAQRGRVYSALMAYAMKDIEPELEGVEKGFFEIMRGQIDANNKKYEDGQKGKEFGKLGGRPKKEKPVGDIDKNPTGVSEKTPNENVNVNENVNENDNKRECKREKPTLDEIKSACKEKNIRQVNPDVFFKYYKSRDWIVNGKDISRKWIDYLELWESREKEKGKPKPRSDFSLKTDYDFDALEKELLGI